MQKEVYPKNLSVHKKKAHKLVSIIRYNMASPERFELPTTRLEGACSIH